MLRVALPARPRTTRPEARPVCAVMEVATVCKAPTCGVRLAQNLRLGAWGTASIWYLPQHTKSHLARKQVACRLRCRFLLPSHSFSPLETRRVNIYFKQKWCHVVFLTSINSLSALLVSTCRETTRTAISCVGNDRSSTKKR